MNPIVKKVLFAACLFLLVYSCKRDDLDFDKFSKTAKIERSIAAPLIIGDLKLQDLLGESTDSIITIKGDTVFQDTVNLDLPASLENAEIEFFNLPYQAKNYLPVGVDLMLITYDSVSNTMLDTIKFAQSGIFLEAAPLDENGLVIEDEVILKDDAINIDNQTAQNLLNVATHIILDARLLADSTRIIPINDVNRIWLKLGLEAKGSFITTIGN